MNAAEWAAWVSAVSSVLALAAAVAAGIVAYLLYRNDEERDKQQMRLTVRAQAELVAGWIDSSGDEPAVIIRNASNLPVWSVLCMYRYALEQAAGLTHSAEQEVGMVPPNLTPARLECPAEVRQAISNGGTCLLTLLFHDASGEVWSRDPLGKLSEQGAVSF